MAGAIPAGLPRPGNIPSGDASTRPMGLIADRPAAAPWNTGYTYAATDTMVLYQSDGATWTAIADIGGGGGGGGSWGTIMGDLEDQTDLQAALDAIQGDIDDHIADATDAHNASAISIADSGNDFTATDVEGALAELQSDAEADAQALTDHIADATDAHDASAISIADAGNDFTATDVEGALAELQSDAEADAQALADHIGDATDAHDASAISVADVGGLLVGSDAEAALAELAGRRMSAGRLISFGHSFGAQTPGPFAAAIPWVNGTSSSDRSRYPELLATIFDVDTSRRFISDRMPAIGTAANDLSTYVFPIPEEGHLEGVWFLPNGAMTGGTTNTRAFGLFITSLGSSFGLVGYRRYVSGDNLAAGDVNTLYDFADPTRKFFLASDGVTPVNVAPGAVSALARVTGVVPQSSFMVFQSLHLASGVADPGGVLVVRWGGALRIGNISGSSLVKSGIHHGGVSSSMLMRPPRRTFGPEVNLTAQANAAAVSLACEALQHPIPSGWKITFTVAGSPITCTTTSGADAGATSIAVSNIGGTAIPVGSQGHARSATTGSYQALTPLGLTIAGWGENDKALATLEEPGWRESVRSFAAIASSPYIQAASRSNTVRTTGNGTNAAIAAYVSPSPGQYIMPAGGIGVAVLIYTGGIGGTPAKFTTLVGPAFPGGTISLLFLAQAGTSKGGAASVLVDGSNPPAGACTVNTSGICLQDNLRTGLSGTVSGTTTLTLSVGTFSSEDVGKAIKGTAGTGTIAKGTKIASVTSSTVAVMDTAGTNGTVTAIELAGYVWMTKRLTGLAAGAHQIDVTLTAMDANDKTAEFIYAGYGIEAPEPKTPILWLGVCRTPNTSSLDSRVATMNTNTQQVIAGTSTPPTGNSAEPALDDVAFVDIETRLGNNVKFFEGDGVHPNSLGHLEITDEAYLVALREFTRQQLAAR